MRGSDSISSPAQDRATPRAGSSVGPMLLGACITLVIVVSAGLIGGLDFSSSDTIINGGSEARFLARALAELDLAPSISETELTQAIDAVRERAQSGDVEATRFLAEILLLSRSAPTAGAGEANDESSG